MRSRRSFLKTASVATLPLLTSRSTAQSLSRDGLIVRMNEPRNLETPPSGLKPWTTPTEQFYVRSHFAVPKVDATTYKLTVTGHVERPFELTLAQLLELSKSSRPLLLECAGNSRVFLIPTSPGLQWSHGAVGTASWTGVPLGALLERAGVKAGAVDVVLTGADKGTIAGPPSSPGVISYDRGIPLEKAKRDECLVATHMNGEPLPVSHGAPARAVIGGWYGMASVKWLTSIVVTDTPHHGFWQTIDYSIWERRNETPTLVPVSTVQPKAVILNPGPNGAVRAGLPVTITGKAWAGERRVAKVEISLDGGKTWESAALDGEEKPYCWRDWSYTWKSPIAGAATITARCTDEKGTAQPATRDTDRRAYQINHLIPVDVSVRE